MARFAVRRGVFAGSGLDALSDATVCASMRALVGSRSSDRPFRVVYVGTATYDLPIPRERQTAVLRAENCLVHALDVALAPLPADAEQVMASADIVLVSGGNTLFACDRWVATGLHTLLLEAARRGCVMAGGSAGAICWFNGGHSDSGDPATWRAALVDGAPVDPKAGASWEYVRVRGLGFVPGLVCPHHDRVQSNGIPRAVDFLSMLKRHPGERGICIDHWAALVVDGDRFRVLALPGRTGSGADGTPAVWVKEVGADGEVRAWQLPSEGLMADALREAKEIVDDPRLAAIRAANT